MSGLDSPFSSSLPEQFCVKCESPCQTRLNVEGGVDAICRWCGFKRELDISKT